MTNLQLHATLAFVMLQPVHELDLLQVLVVELLPLRGQSLVACTVLLQVRRHLVPLLCDALSLLVFLFKLKPRESRTKHSLRQGHKRSSAAVDSCHGLSCLVCLSLHLLPVAVQLFLQFTHPASQLLFHMLLRLNGTGQLHVLISLRKMILVQKAADSEIFICSWRKGLPHQFDEAILQLGQLVLQGAILGERAADGGLVRLDVLQHAPAVLHLLGSALHLLLQIAQTCLLLSAEPA